MEDYSFLNRFKEVKPHQLGWLRRPDLEKGDEQVWERPDGTLQAFLGRRRKVRIVLLDKQVMGPSFFTHNDDYEA
jgi:hypothetical protein